MTKLRVHSCPKHDRIRARRAESMGYLAPGTRIHRNVLTNDGGIHLASQCSLPRCGTPS
jgi:hypothetical protein